MEENVALDSSQQKQFVKSVRGIKKLLKKKNKNAQKSTTSKDDKPKVEIKPLKVTKVKKIKRRKLRGLVYISHIPHGFYEPQMAEYFKQFGVVTNVRVIRSKKTGNSKGFAFVEFKEPSVAEIVAETMNNYLMGKRLLKAVYIPPKKQKLNVFRKNWNNQNNPASEQRLKIRKAYNASKTDAEEVKIAKKLLASLSKTKEKLSNLGIDYDFFKPVDVPEELKDIADKIGKEEKETKSEKKLKTDLTEVKVENKKKIKLETKENNENKSNKQKKVKGPLKAEAESNNKLNIKTVKTDNKLVEDVKNQVKSKKVDKNKNDKVKIEDIKPLQNFISIKNDDNSSSEDEDDDFDSDEFEKLMESEDEDDMSSGEESDEENDDSEAVTESEDDQSEKKGKQQKAKQNNSLLTKNTAKVTRSNLGKKRGPENSNVGNQLQKKRKNVQNAPVPPKKAKFEKQNKKKPLKKVIKKKK